MGLILQKLSVAFRTTGVWEAQKALDVISSLAWESYSSSNRVMLQVDIIL